MKTTSWVLIPCVAVGLTLTAGAALAAPNPGSWNLLVATMASGQSGEESEPAGNAKAQAAELLIRARRAMRAGDFETAESLIEKAEGLNVSYGRISIVDTPKKARLDLERRKGAKGRVKRPSQLYAPRDDESDEKPSSAPRDPFANRASPTGAPLPPRSIYSPEKTPPSESEPMSGLTGNQAFPERSPFGKRPVTAPPDDLEDEVRMAPRGASADEDKRAESDRLLLAARRALAVGDVRRTVGLAKQAEALGLDYEFNQDSPEKVRDIAALAAKLAERAPDERGNESYHRQQAELLMQQSEGLIQWQDFDEAERLANDANKLGVAYGPFDPKPSAVLQRIVAARKQGGAARLEPLPQVDPNDRPRVSDATQLPLDAETAGRKAEVSALVRKARTALDAGDLRRAETLAQEAEGLHVPDNAFGKNEDKPWLVLYKIQQLRKERAVDVVRATNEEPIGTEPESEKRYPDEQAVYDRDNDRTENVQAKSQEEIVTPDAAMTMYLRGEEALKKHDVSSALKWFREANARRDELDPAVRQQLQDKLQFLSQQPAPSRRPGGAAENSLLNKVDAAQQARYRETSGKLNLQEAKAKKLQEINPKEALEILENARAEVVKSEVDGTTRDILLRRVDRSIDELKRYIDENRARIELNEKNDDVRDEIEHRREVKVEVQEKLAKLVHEFNTLMEEKRFPEAEVLAKRAYEMAPNEPIVAQLRLMIKMVKRNDEVMGIRADKEQGFYQALTEVDRSAIPMNDNTPFIFGGNAKDWENLSVRRRKFMREGRMKRSEKEIEIEQKLKTPVSLGFHEAPLDEVISKLSQLTQISMILDPRGLAEEGVDSHTPVTIDLNQEISLKSALNLILAPLQLSYVIKNEVLNITSEQLRDGEVYTVTYNVADLVIPIPNFDPNKSSGLKGALADAYAQIPMYGGGGGNDTIMPVAATASGANANVLLHPDLMAQMNKATGMGSAMSRGDPTGFGPGGLGGGDQADFESLIELITSTIAPTTWAEVGGPGTINEFKGNLSLVVSQTQEVHEEIADLLDQLRRLQDLQVTIEVRFISLNDNFFERIGVSFDLNIPTYSQKPFALFGQQTSEVPITTPTAFPPPGQNRDYSLPEFQTNQGVTVGMATATTYSANLDIPVQQGSFPLAIPQFGGYQAGAGAQLGFAILSKLEAFFFIEASQGDRRSNVLQAPKVTLFNGQRAFVQDLTYTPFVISVIPVVGAFAAANQPVILVLNEGSALSVQAVVSNDRRFVRLTLVPFFSKITAVNTFTFTGSSSSTQSASQEGPSDLTTARSNSQANTSEGTTVQLPSFAVFSVATTVSVPDGGTVLLGGIKRLSEGRNEFGVPLLSKIPYVNRLFTNTATGRETQSLMMMVTPRIIILEEEEENLGIPTAP